MCVLVWGGVGCVCLFVVWRVLFVFVFVFVEWSSLEVRLADAGQLAGTHTQGSAGRMTKL